jgi:hypothetical protein
VHEALCAEAGATVVLVPVIIDSDGAIEGPPEVFRG